MTRTLRIVGICGSLRQGSYHKLLLQQAIQCAPAQTEIVVLPIDNIPLYNADLDQEGGPEAVQQFKQAIAAADGVLILTPEYNYSVPGVLKNALDWASRPAYRSVFANKPVAILSASAGPLGGSRAQTHLREILFGMLAVVFPHKEYLLPLVSGKFDESGTLTDPKSRDLLTQYLQDWQDWFHTRSS